MVVPTDVLEALGDPVEKSIARRTNDGFRGIDVLVVPYATIWSEDILPRRLPDDKSRVENGWMNFAGSHYSAIIKVYSAAKALDRIAAMCQVEAEPYDGDFLLELHEKCDQFWRDMGSAIDNLGACFTWAPVVKEKEPGKDYLCGRDKTDVLRFIYDRRTQYIHSRVVPVGATAAGVTFRFEQIEGLTGNYANSPKSTDWEQVFTKERLLDDYCLAVWEKFRTSMSDAWWHLHARFRQGEPNPPKPAYEVVSTVEITEIPVIGGRLEIPAPDWAVPPSTIKIDDPRKRPVVVRVDPTIPPSGAQPPRL